MSVHNEEYINQLIRQMDALGYFKYSSEEELEDIQEDLWFGFKIKCLNPTLDEQLMSIGKERRYLMLDHHSIMDRDFVPFFLDEIQPILSHLEIEIEDLEVGRSRNYAERICNIIDAVNQIIIKDQDHSERFYLINKDEELACMLLTPALQVIFETHIEDKNDHPLSTDEWIDLHF